MFAVIATGGKQYVVRKGTRVKVEKIAGEEGAEVFFDEVLFRGNNEKVELGVSAIKGGSVKAKILAQGRHKKVMGIKHKAKKRYKVKFGHRQEFTEVEIVSV